MPLITVIWNHSAAARTRARTTPTPTAGTRTTTSSTCCATTCCRASTRASRRCWKTWTSAACSTRRWWSAWASSAGRRGWRWRRKFAGSSPGRKHWANVYSIVLAGAGVARGAVFGASDRIAAYPQSDRVGPWDVAATMFSALGVDPRATTSTRWAGPSRSPSASRSPASIAASSQDTGLAIPETGRYAIATLRDLPAGPRGEHGLRPGPARARPRRG